MEAKTTVRYRGKEYPFYRTNRGTWDFEAAGFTNDDLVKGSGRAALALVFFQLRDCAKRAGQVFGDSLDEFVDNAATDITEVFVRLKGEKEKMGKPQAPEGEQPPSPQKGEEGRK